MNLNMLIRENLLGITDRVSMASGTGLLSTAALLVLLGLYSGCSAPESQRRADEPNPSEVGSLSTNSSQRVLPNYQELPQEEIADSGNGDQPQPDLDDLLSGNVLEQRERELRSELTGGLGELRDFIFERVTDNYLLSLNEPHTGNPLRCSFNDVNDEGEFLNCRVSFETQSSRARPRIRERGYRDRQVEFTRIIDGDDFRDVIAYFQDQNNDFVVSKTPNGQELRISVSGLQNQLSRLGFYSSSRDNDWGYYSSVDNDLTIGRNENGFYVRFPEQDRMEPRVVELAQQELVGLANLLQMFDLALNKYGIANWLDDNLETVEQHLENFLEGLEQHRRERAAQEEAQQLIPDFAEEIRERGEYTRLIRRDRFSPFFTAYAFLSEFDNVNTRIEDPVLLNNLLQRVNTNLETMPVDYQTLFSNLNFYVAMSRADLQTNCQWENAGACYDPNTDTMYVTADVDRGTLAHELAHAKVAHLSDRSRRALSRVLEPIVGLAAMQNDVVRENNERAAVTSWVSGRNRGGPRYVCPDPYCATNADEFLAEYVEDIFGNESNGIISLIQGRNLENRRMIVTAVDTFAEHGLLGEDGTLVANDLYRRAGLGDEALTVLR